MSDKGDALSEKGSIDPPTLSDRESTAKFDRDELVRGWRAYESRQPQILPALKYAAKTDMGQVRENNEDKFDYYEPEIPAILAERGSLFAVADGIGGAQAGQIASEILVKSLIAGYYDHPSADVITALYEAIVASNDRIYGLAQMIPERNGMGSTLTAAVYIEGRVIVAQVGDSRAYCVRNGNVFQITRDHSWVEDQVSAGVLTRAEAEQSPFRNVITRSVGAAAAVQPDFYEEQSQAGDVWVLCSDGMSGYVKPEEIGKIAGNNAPSEAARQFIELANARGGRDNITVFVIAVRALRPYAAIETAVAAPIEIPKTEEAALDGNGKPAEPAVAVPMATAPEPIPAPPSAPGQEPPPTVWRRLFGGGNAR